MYLQDPSPVYGGSLQPRHLPHLLAQHLLSIFHPVGMNEKTYNVSREITPIFSILN